MMYLAILMFAIFFAGFAMTVNEGLWSNTISLFCVILAGLMALPGGLALGAFAVEQAKPAAENEWAFVFGSIWGVFFFAVMILRIVTDRISRVRMKFFKPLDIGGGILMGLGVSMMLTSFTALTLFLPFAAGVWKPQEAPAWQSGTIVASAIPMFSVSALFYSDEIISQIQVAAKQ